MIKKYKFLSGILAIIGCITIVNAQNLGDLIDNLGTNISFWYTNDKLVDIKNFGANNIVTLESPLLKDGSGTTITSYTVMYSQYPLTDILEKTDLLNQTKESNFEVTGNQNPFTMDVTVAVAPTDANKKYYFFVIPKDTNKNLWQISNEVWANFADQTKWAAWDSVWTHNASTTSEVDLSLAHISHTLNGNTITLTWSAIEGSKTLDIDVMKPGESLFNKITNVNMNAEKYVYTADKNGEYVFRFTAIDCGKQINYTVTMEGAKTVVTPTAKITKVPKTGPTENAIVILLIAIGLYFGYTKLHKKTK